jgi:DNA-binding CsgD family transcriptional regulator
MYFRLGQLGNAEADAHNGIDAMASLGLVSPPAMIVDVLIERGRLDDAFVQLEQTGCAGALAPSFFSILLLVRRIRLLVAAGRLHDALADVATAEQWVASCGMGDAVTLPWRTEGALALLAAGDHERAQSLADEQLALAERFGLPGVLGVALRAAGLTHGRERGLVLLADSVATLAGTQMRLEHARSLAALGAAQRRSGERAQARETLAEALDAATACGAAVLAEEARTELRVAGARPRRNRRHGPDALTTNELRIATFAVEGMTNAQIAQRLFVTAKTVERQLTNVYAKLGIGSRRELGDALGERRPADNLLSAH